MQKNKGFVLAFSLLISSIVLALALGIFNILLKQIVLTSTAAESQIAFYAADAGAECGLYWDTHKTYNASDYDTDGNFKYRYTGAFQLIDINPDLSLGYGPQPTITCGDISVTPTYNSGKGTSVLFFAVGGGCAKLEIVKDNIGQFETIITSRGYNVACSELEVNTASKRVVERAIEVKY